MNVYPYKNEQDQSLYLARQTQPGYLSNNAYFTRQEPYEIPQQPFSQYAHTQYQNEAIDESVVVQSQPQIEKDKIQNLIGSNTNQKNNLQNNSPKINWILYWFIIIFLIVVAVVSGGIYFQHYKKIRRPDQDLSILKKAIVNLKSPPIIDTYSLESNHHFQKHLNPITEKQIVGDFDLKQLDNQHCTNGYSFTEIGQFFGIQSGCICENGRVIHSLRCIIAGNKCKRVSNIEQKNLYSWGKNKLCVKTSTDWEYVGTKICRPEQQKCSRGLCISKHEKCPVVNFNRLTGSETAEEKLQLRDAYEIKRDLDKQPIIGFTLTPGVLEEAPCFDSEFQPQFESKKFYPLAKVPEKGCKDQMTDYKISLDSQTEKEVYDNNHLQATLKNIPFWNKLTSSTTDHFHLQAIRRIKLGNHEDCDYLNANSLENSHSQGDQLFWSTKWISILLLAVTVFGLSLALFLYVFRNKMIGSLHVSAISQTKIIYWIAFMAALIIVLNGYIYVRNVEMKGGLRAQDTYFTSYIRQQCFVDLPIHKSFQQFASFVKSVYSSTEIYMKVGLLAGIIFIVLSIIMVLIQVFYYTENVCQDPWK